MNSVLCLSTDAELDDCRTQTDMTTMVNAPTLEESYATTPMRALNAVRLVSDDEEELHTSFEEAISGRLVAMQGRLSRISGPLLHNQHTHRDTDPVIVPVNQESTRSFGKAWQRRVLFGSLGLMCVTIGFDLMGLLVLHLHM